MVHTEDVVSAIAMALESRAPGAFNLAAPQDVTAHDIATALGARLIPVPARVLRFGVSAGWHARLLQLDPGWIDLAKRVPLLDTGRARAELGWSPTRTGPEVLREVITGMADAAYGDSPVLRSRTVADQVDVRSVKAPSPIVGSPERSVRGPRNTTDSSAVRSDFPARRDRRIGNQPRRTSSQGWVLLYSRKSARMALNAPSNSAYIASRMTPLRRSRHPGQLSPA